LTKVLDANTQQLAVHYPDIVSSCFFRTLPADLKQIRLIDSSIISDFRQDQLLQVDECPAVSRTCPWFGSIGAA